MGATKVLYGRAVASDGGWGPIESPKWGSVATNLSPKSGFFEYPRPAEPLGAGGLLPRVTGLRLRLL